VAQKPLDGTIANNVMTHGVGAMNIDGCRVPTVDNLNGGTYSGKKRDDGSAIYGKSSNGIGEYQQPVGRFPANLVHDGSQEVLNLFPDTGKSGSTARFFYCAKASKKDRGEGNNHPTVKPNSLMRWLVRLVCPQGGAVLDPFMGSGSTGVACMQEGMEFVGIDMEEHYCDIARRRISNEPLTAFNDV
jgi:site-specific DNA-methyltransferase (adenine-specific)